MSSTRIPRTRRQAVELGEHDLVQFSRFDDSPRAPWVARPSSDAVELAGWAQASRQLIEERLHQTGAILFRAFGLSSAEQFERAAAAITPELYGGYGDLPREGESANIYKSTPYPADQPILFHQESSHLQTWPMRISFFCLAAAAEGGETPLADCRAVAAELDPEVLQEFRAKGLRYLRNFSPGVDVSWQQFFQTDDRAEVERRCRAGGMQFEWGDGDRLRIVRPARAVAVHPVTGEEVFFNQIQLHHPHHLPAGVRESLLELAGSEEALPRNVTFGDGSAISDDIAEHCLGVYWRVCVMFPWERGDIITLDNMLTAHARMPFRGERRIAVAMAGMSSG
jgi:alpha-ketoglutarate-dependent taurine dioxygenase